MKKKQIKNLKLNKQKISVLSKNEANNVIGATTGQCVLTVKLVEKGVTLILGCNKDKPLSQDNVCNNSVNEQTCQCDVA